MLRRHFLACALGGAILLPVGRSAVAAATLSLPAGRNPRLVVVFLRGAIDGLNVVVPYHDPEYYRSRESIAIPPPGKDDGGLDLDGRFALHPALAPLLPRWQAGQLAFVHAAGSPDPTRSHFDAQDYMESGTPGRKSTPDGWLNRMLGILPGGKALNVGTLMPRALSGTQPVDILASGRSATRPNPLDRPRIGSAFDELYNGDGDMEQAYRSSRQSRREMMAALSGEELEAEMRGASNGAGPASAFAEDANRLARLMRNDARIRLAFAAIGGWDTHANQGASHGQLANRLKPLGNGLAALMQSLGPVLDETVVVVMSEFGRTVRQNGTGGTDHGHGNTMCLLGGPVAGGRVYGRWPGLDSGALHEGRDLAVTTDFRTVLLTVAERHLRLRDRDLVHVFPGFSANPLPLIRAV